MLEPEEDEEEEEEELLELLLLLLLLPPPSSDFSCPRTSTETIEAGVPGERALHSKPSSRAAFHGSGGFAPGPERR